MNAAPAPRAVVHTTGPRVHYAMYLAFMLRTGWTGR